MVYSRSTFTALVAAAIISGVSTYPTAQNTDQNPAVPGDGLAAPAPDTGSSTPTAPDTATTTKRIAKPTVIPGTYLDAGAIIGIVIAVLFLLVCFIGLSVTAYRLTQVRTKVALMKRRAKDKACVKASRHKARRAANSSRPVNARQARDEHVAFDAEAQAEAGRGRSSWSRSHEMVDLPARVYLSVADNGVMPPDHTGADSRSSHTGLSELREISPGASAQGENRNSRTVPIPRGTRSNSVSSMASTNNRNLRRPSLVRKRPLSTAHADRSYRR